MAKFSTSRILELCNYILRRKTSTELCCNTCGQLYLKKRSWAELCLNEFGWLYLKRKFFDRILLFHQTSNIILFPDDNILLSTHLNHIPFSKTIFSHKRLCLTSGSTRYCSENFNIACLPCSKRFSCGFLWSTDLGCCKMYSDFSPCPIFFGILISGHW